MSGHIKNRSRSDYCIKEVGEVDFSVSLHFEKPKKAT